MKSSKMLIGVFAAVAAVQLAVPASLIVRHELTLQQGTVFRFKTAPVDPYDAFRGRYAALQFEENRVRLPTDKHFANGQKAYVALETDRDGFAKFGAVSDVAPKDKPYLRVHLAWPEASGAQVRLPFDRLYLEENIAPAAEQVYWQNNRRGQTNTASYALVRVRNGTGVIEDVFVGDKPLTQLVREQRKK